MALKDLYDLYIKLIQSHWLYLFYEVQLENFYYMRLRNTALRLRIYVI